VPVGQDSRPVLVDGRALEPGVGRPPELAAHALSVASVENDRPGATVYDLNVEAVAGVGCCLTKTLDRDLEVHDCLPRPRRSRYRRRVRDHPLVRVRGEVRPRLVDLARPQGEGGFEERCPRLVGRESRDRLDDALDRARVLRAPAVDEARLADAVREELFEIGERCLRLAHDGAPPADPLGPRARKLVEFTKRGIARIDLRERARPGKVVGEELSLLARLEGELTSLLLDCVTVLDDRRRNEQYEENQEGNERH
jgi:hypothetical protein